MTHDELEKLFSYGDSSPEAVRRRMIAARNALGMQQQEVAAAVGVRKQTYNYQESRGAPSIPVARYFHRAHKLSFNFLFHGDFDQIDAAMLEKLAEALSAGSE